MQELSVTSSGLFGQQSNISWGDNTYQPWNIGYYYPYPVTVTEKPRECSGEVHVFPCPHCAKCKCGATTKVEK